MATVVNLRTVRKQRKRTDDRKGADTRAAKFGEASVSAKLRRAEAARSDNVLDGHRRDEPDD